MIEIATTTTRTTATLNENRKSTNQIKQRQQNEISNRNRTPDKTKFPQSSMMKISMKWFTRDKLGE